MSEAAKRPRALGVIPARGGSKRLPRKNVRVIGGLPLIAHTIRAAQAAHNLRFFGAPVGMICVIDRKLEIGSWIDYGMFLQNIAIAARARGLDTCHMAIFAQFGENIRRLLNLSESDVVVCGVALGHEDPTSPANRLRTERVPATEFTELRGF